MISTVSTGAGLFRPPVVVPVAVWLLSLRGGQLPVAPAQPLVRETMPVEIIDISDDDAEIDWDLLRRDSDEEERTSAARVGKKQEEEPTVALWFLPRILIARGSATTLAFVAVGRG